MIRIRTLYPTYSTGRAISHIVLSLCEHMRSERSDVRLYFCASDPDGRRSFTSDAVPDLLRRAAYRLDPTTSTIRRFTEFSFRRSLGTADVAWIWPDVTPRTYQAARDAGAVVVGERVNTHRLTSRRILDAAYRRLGLPPTHGITERAAREETQKLLLCDWVFSPSPHVTRSLEDAGIPADRVLPSSYGWDPERLARDGPGLPPTDGLSALFVGRGCFRKGVDLLLRAWAAASVPGRLAIVGRLDEEVGTHCADLLARPDVAQLPYRDIVGPIYRSADVFVFPSLEEGSPLVLYEAMASGLPVLASPMAAGEILRDGVEGIVLDPLDQDAWVAALRRLAKDPDLRRRMGRSARERAADFTWQRVGRRRLAMLQEALTRRGAGSFS
ncbi:MAG TPA: glycosyltransferase family 4 protein [Planctomycetota bacterium]